MLEVIERDEKDAHIRLSWLDHRSGSAIRMWDDLIAKVRYLELRAPDAAQMKRLRDELTAALALSSRAVLLERGRTSMDGDPSTLTKVAYGAGDQPDEETVAAASARR